MSGNNQKSAFIAIVGRPNVGKSSILNQFIGQKIAIVSDKPQTTRTKITGILTEQETQLVFIDTPGLHRPHNALGEHMVRAVGDGMAEVDCCLLVVEAGAKRSPTETELELISRFKKRGLKAVLAINKIDTVQDKSVILQDITKYTELFDFAAVVPVCARTGEGLDALLAELRSFAVPSVHYFDDMSLTDQPERVLAAEIIREKLLVLLDKEVPHGVAVDIERFSEREDSDILDLEASVYCERESHKGIVIGKNGSMLKRVGTLARADLESFFECRVNLKLWVKVRENWRSRQGYIRSLGLD